MGMFKAVWARESGATVTFYDDEPFIIFDSWDQHDAVLAKYNAENSGDQLRDLYDQVPYGFSDEYAICDNCGNAIRTSPDCYGWQADYDQDQYGIYCKDCTRENARLYLDLRINTNKLVNAWVVDPADHGWTMLDHSYENGMHHGQNADPKLIIKALNDHGIDCLFTGSVGQFDIRFYVWVKDDDISKADDILQSVNTDLPYDQATELSKALRGEHSDHITVKTYTVTHDDFIKGNLPK